MSIQKSTFFCVVFLLMLAGCQTAYYKAMEKVGYHKRDILVERVEDARDSQKEAKEQFETALQRFSAVLNFQGGELEEKYRQLKEEFDESEEKAEELHDRIESVEGVAEDLFAEWKSELKQYSSKTMRRSSEKKLKQTQRKYEQLIGAMKRVEQRIDPVISAFRDQVLYLKHNLNAQAILSLKSELESVETDVASLIREMEASIREADTFLQSMAQR